MEMKLKKPHWTTLAIWAIAVCFGWRIFVETGFFTLVALAMLFMYMELQVYLGRD